jgi:hypothetical protein
MLDVRDEGGRTLTSGPSIGVRSAGDQHLVDGVDHRGVHHLWST